MRTLRSLLLMVFAVLAGTSVFYAYQQQKSLRTARLAAESLEKERNELRKKLWDSQRRIASLEALDRPTHAAAEREAEGPPLTSEAGMMEAALRAANDGPGGFGRLMAMMDNPEFQKLVSTQQRGALDTRYAALFRNLNLSPAQLEQFKNLLVEKRTAVADVMAAARSQGLTGRESRDELRALVDNAQSEVDANIRATIGEAAFAQYQGFEQTQAQRAVVSQLEQRLSYSGTPLTPQQTEQLVQVLAANPSEQGNVARAGGIRTPAGRIGFGGTGGATITDSALAQSATVLAASQVQALQQIRQEQQAQQQISQLVREQMRNRGRNGSGNPTPTPTAVPPKG
jgi:hypothetical protein